jgi:hypothetical protein
MQSGAHPFDRRLGCLQARFLASALSVQHDFSCVVTLGSDEARMELNGRLLGWRSHQVGSDLGRQMCNPLGEDMGIAVDAFDPLLYPIRFILFHQELIEHIENRVGFDR